MKRSHVLTACAAAAVIGCGTVTALALTGPSGSDGPAAGRHAGAAHTGAAPAAGRHSARPAWAGGGPAAAPRNPTADEAVAAALHARSGTVESAELDRDRSGRCWEIDLLGADGTWYDARVDAVSGAVRVAADHDDEDGGDTGALRHARVDARNAAAAARTLASGTVVSVEFDGDRGAHRWEAEVRGTDGTTRELVVNPATGSVTADRDD